MDDVPGMGVEPAMCTLGIVCALILGDFNTLQNRGVVVVESTFLAKGNSDEKLGSDIIMSSAFCIVAILVEHSAVVDVSLTVSISLSATAAPGTAVSLLL